jgi:hypothetical protein
MMFTDNFQTICSAKAGNYKSFAKADLYDHYGSSEVSTRATGLFGGFDGGRPPQGEYLYQRNAMGTINTINKLDSVTTFKVNADYSYQRAAHDIGQSSTYLTGDGSYVTVAEQTSPLTKIHLPRLSMNYQKNADRSYLDETFVVKGKFEQNEGDVLANQQQIEQRRKASSFEVVDNVYWSSRSLKGAYRYLNGGISFKRTPMLRLSFYDNGKAYGQTAQSSTLSMNLGSSFDIPIGKTFRINLPVSINAAYDDLETVYSPPSQGGAGGGSLSREDIDRIRRARRAEIAQSDMPAPKVQPFEFFCVRDTKDVQAQVVFVGHFDPDTDQIDMATWEDVQRLMAVKSDRP